MFACAAARCYGSLLIAIARGAYESFFHSGPHIAIISLDQPVNVCECDPAVACLVREPTRARRVLIFWFFSSSFVVVGFFVWMQFAVCSVLCAVPNVLCQIL